VAIVDLWSSKTPPSPEDLLIKAGVSDIIVKVSVSISSAEGDNDAEVVSMEDVESVIHSFKPDVSVLVLRHPAVNMASLNSKVLKRDPLYCGLVDAVYYFIFNFFLNCALL
jgi:hypothetical protein